MPYPTRPFERLPFWFAVLAAITLCLNGLAAVFGPALSRSSSGGVGWLPPVVAAVAAGAVGAALIEGLVLRPHRARAGEMERLRAEAAAGQAAVAQFAGRSEGQRRLRHDLRGALSPALLTADRLASHADPAVKRAGEIMVTSIDRAAALLADPEER